MGMWTGETPSTSTNRMSMPDGIPTSTISRWTERATTCRIITSRTSWMQGTETNNIVWSHTHQQITMGKGRITTWAVTTSIVGILDLVISSVSSTWCGPVGRIITTLIDAVDLLLNMLCLQRRNIVTLSIP